MRDGWTQTTLGDVASVGPKEPSLSIEAPFIPMDAVSTDGRWVKYTEPRGNRSGARARAQDVLFARITPCLENGKVAQVPPGIERCGGSTELLVIRPSQQTIPAFIYYWAKSASTRALATRLMTGSTGRQRLSSQDLAALPIRLPPPSDQRRIVDLLESVDSYIDALRVQADAARAVLTALLHSEITRFGSAVRADEAFEIRMGRQRSPQHATGIHMVPYLRAANAKDGYLDLDDVLEMNFTPDEQVTFALRDGDVLVTEGCGSREQVGASTIWRGELPSPVCFQNTLIRIRAIEGLSTPGFAHWWARHSFLSGAFADVASGTNIFHIGSTRLAAMPVALPSLREQDRITDLCDSVQTTLDATAASQRSAITVRSSLLSNLLSGDHEIPGSYDALLEAS